jgi:hypothetical protein
MVCTYLTVNLRCSLHFNRMHMNGHTQEKSPSIHWIGSCVEPMASLDAAEERRGEEKTSCPYQVLGI